MLKHKQLWSYITGFTLSIILTGVAFFLVNLHVNSGHLLISHSLLTWAILTLAFCQLLVQLMFFLHLGQGPNSRWNLVMIASTVGIIFIVIAGSIWIMNHLNYNMTPIEMNQYLIDQEGFSQ